MAEAVATQELRLDARHITAYLLLGLGFATMMGFIYMQYVYYDAMIDSLQVTNNQLGLLLTIKAFGDIIGAIPAGLIVDRFDCKKVLTISLGISMLTCLAFALAINYQVALVVWFLIAFLSAAWYPAVYKVVRVIAPENGIGKSFGMFGVGVAIGSIIVNVAGLALYDFFAETSYIVGLRSILLAFFTAGMISCIGGWLAIKDIPTTTEEGEETMKINLKNLKAVFTDPATYLFLLGCFSIYAFQVSLSYFTPYFTAVLGTTVALSGIVAVFRQYGVRIISAPLGGWIGDKIGSTAKVIRVSMILLFCLVLVVLFLPKDTPLGVLIAIVFILGFLGTMNISLQSSISSDALLPRKHMGVVVAMTAFVSADLFQPALFGMWLDNHGNDGYTYIWIYTLCMILFCIAVLTIMINRKKRKAERNELTGEFAWANADGGASWEAKKAAGLVNEDGELIEDAKAAADVAEAVQAEAEVK